MKSIAASLLFSFAASAFAAPLERIAFGSCCREYLPQPIWNAVSKFQPEVWIWMGDNVYGDSKDPNILRTKYDQQKANPDYAELAKNCQVIGIWDDHDFGNNNGGREYPSKKESQAALLDFLDEPKDSARRAQQGVYWAYENGDGNQSVQVILLDVRYFKEGKGGPTAELLGDAQWRWLESQIENSQAPLRFIVSGIQALHEDHKYEKWSNFPAERKRLLELIAKQASGQTVILSGDRHISEFAKLQLPGSDKYVYEFTSSSLTHSWATFPGEPNRHRIGNVYSKNSFGTAEIDWDSRKLQLAIRSEDGRLEDSLDVDF